MRIYAKKVNIDFYKICGRFVSCNKKNINFAPAKTAALITEMKTRR
jgi:hypothetical protein